MEEIHNTWNQMAPLENEINGIFSFEDYYKRIVLNKKFNKIPKDVFEQWIYCLHNDFNTRKNYAWLNFEQIEFNLTEWTFNEINCVNIIDEFKDYVNLRSKNDNLEQFNCIEKDLDFWKSHGTWRVPPIILDVKSLKNSVPEWAEITPPFQLVEGHTRIGYLKSLEKITNSTDYNISNNHKFYLMSKI